MQYQTPQSHSSVRWLRNRSVLLAPAKAGSTLIGNFDPTVPQDWYAYKPRLIVRHPVDRLCSAYNMLVYKDINSCTTESEIDAYWQQFMVWPGNTAETIGTWRRNWGGTWRFAEADPLATFESFVETVMPVLIESDPHIQSQTFYYTAVQPNCPLYKHYTERSGLPLEQLSEFLQAAGYSDRYPRNALRWYIPASRRRLKNCAAMQTAVQRYYARDLDFYYQSIDK